MDEFKSDLAKLLAKHEVSLVCRSALNYDDYSVEIGFQHGVHNEWIGRHHITPHDLIACQED